jgi:hypothetical protein
MQPEECSIQKLAVCRPENRSGNGADSKNEQRAVREQSAVLDMKYRRGPQAARIHGLHLAGRPIRLGTGTSMRFLFQGVEIESIEHVTIP